MILGFDRSGHAPNILLLGRKDGKPMAEASVARPDKTVLSAPDATAVAARLAAAGYAPAAIKVNPAMDVRNFFVTDPDGRRLEIVQLRRSLQAPH